MIEFVTLFLGFVLGPHPVELATDGAADAVAIYLDGTQVARLEVPPWKCEVDFGSVLEPHRLEARAYDKAGRELGRVGQLVNYSRSDFRASLVLDPISGPGGGRGGRLHWAAVLNQNPTWVDLRLDGVAVLIEPDGTFILPPLDAGETHFLEAELVFAAGQTVRSELSFGGAFGDRVTSALTAVPLASPPGRGWSTEEVEGWFLRRDASRQEPGEQGVRVFAARAEDGVLLVVRSQQVDKALKHLRRDRRAAIVLENDHAFKPENTFDMTAISTRPLKQFEGTFELRPLARAGGRVALENLLGREELLFGRVKKKKKEQLWDALALAGRHAASSNRPRAVILMIGSQVSDHGVVSGSQAAHYLASVGVPLLVWAPDAAALEFLEIHEESMVFTGLSGLEGLARQAALELASQTIVWLEGEYLPRELMLATEVPAEVEFL